MSSRRRLVTRLMMDPFSGTQVDVRLCNHSHWNPKEITRCGKVWTICCHSRMKKKAEMSMLLKAQITSGRKHKVPIFLGGGEWALGPGWEDIHFNIYFYNVRACIIWKKKKLKWAFDKIRLAVLWGKRERSEKLSLSLFYPWASCR